MWTFLNITSQAWFEAFVMANIFLIAVATVCDLENRNEDVGIQSFVDATSTLTTVVFTVECFLKLVTEAYSPLEYFTDTEDGAFNTFDFIIVVMSYAFMGSAESSALGALRLLRLLRLLTFIKGVPQLRVIVVGLLAGLRSVSYIVMLLFLVMNLLGGCSGA